MKTEDLTALAKVVTAPSSGDAKNILAGFDGFIDIMIQMKHPKTMESFGSTITDAAGIAMSAQVGYQGQQFGGNGPLLVMALHSACKDTVNIDYVGSLGEESVLPVFSDRMEGAMQSITTFAKPGVSTCLEFSDGKIMLSDFESLDKVNWQQWLAVQPEASIKKQVEQMDMLVAVNWGKVPNVFTIWEGITKMVKACHKGKLPAFVDLAEFDQRSEADKQNLPSQLKHLSEAFDITLSLNLKEGWQFASILGDDSFKGDKAKEKVLECAAFIREKLDLHQVIIHPNDGAVIATESESHFLTAPLCKEPLISTGAGDHFGAGVVAAITRGLSPLEQIITGVCFSGYFVRSGTSPSWEQVGQFLKFWAEDKVTERL